MWSLFIWRIKVLSPLYGCLIIGTLEGLGCEHKRVWLTSKCQTYIEHSLILITRFPNPNIRECSHFIVEANDTNLCLYGHKIIAAYLPWNLSCYLATLNKDNRMLWRCLPPTFPVSLPSHTHTTANNTVFLNTNCSPLLCSFSIRFKFLRES